MNSIGYVGTRLNDEEQHLTLEDVRPLPLIRSRSAAPWACAVLLFIAGVGGGASWRSASPVSGIDVISASEDISQTQLWIPLNILGVSYSGLDPDDKPKFETAVKRAIGTKAKISWSGTPTLVHVDSSHIRSSTPIQGSDDHAARSVFVVKVDVPVELSAVALQTRLNEKGDLFKKIEEQIQNSIEKVTHPVVLSSGIQIKTVKNSKTTIDDQKPLIVLDIDIRGVYYAKLTAGTPEMRKNFAAAIQAAIASESSAGIDATSVAMDVGDGGLTDGSPYVHVTAKIPTPAGVSSDATMSQWTGGTGGIAAQVLAQVKALKDIDFLTENVAGVAQSVAVSSSAFRLGGIRETFQTKITMELAVHRLWHDGKKLKDHASELAPDEASIKQKITEVLAKKATVDESAITLTQVAIAPVLEPNLLRYRAVILASSHVAAASKVSDWETKLLPAGYELQQFYKDAHPHAIQDEEHQDQYRWMVGITSTDNEVASIDLDLVVHGVSLGALSSEKKNAFLNEFATHVRKGLGEGVNNLGFPDGRLDYEKIRVTMHPGGKNAVNVRAEIPVQELNYDKEVIATMLADLEKPARKDNLEAEMKLVDGLTYLSSWTTDAVTVSMPGEINDFVGDVSSTSDEQ